MVRDLPAHRPTHIATCASCRSCLQASLTLEKTLRQEAVQRREELGTSETLQREILRAVRVAAPKPDYSRGRSAGRAWAVGGLGAVAAIVALMAGLRHEPIAEQRGSVSEPATTAEVAVIIETVDSLSNEFVESVLPTAGGLVANNPLQRELTSVYSDMRSALDFLALNFLPAAPATANSIATPTRRI
jgi:hypothetical protein